MQIPDLNGRDRPCLHGEAGADLNRQNMRMQWNPNVFRSAGVAKQRSNSWDQPSQDYGGAYPHRPCY